jgi:hypothetical protein
MHATSSWPASAIGSDQNQAGPAAKMPSAMIA